MLPIGNLYGIRIFVKTGKLFRHFRVLVKEIRTSLGSQILACPLESMIS